MFEGDLLPELEESMESVLKTDSTMLKEIEKIPIQHFLYVLIKKEPVWKKMLILNFKVHDVLSWDTFNIYKSVKS